MKAVPDLAGHARPLGPYSHAVVANGFVFVSAQTPAVPGGKPGEWAAPDIQGQTRQCLRNLESILKELGLGLESVVKTTVFLRDPKDFKPMNEAYKEFFPSEPPARSPALLGADAPGALVAIEGVAVYEPRSEE
jgi:2-iminobutanoate/2-iminopropanoate deaminase